MKLLLQNVLVKMFFMWKLIISATPNSFNASESSPKWRAAHQKILEVYQQMKVAPQQSTTLHGHFVELYSALKQGLHAYLFRVVLPNVLQI
jgi:hypothetical protein